MWVVKLGGSLSDSTCLVDWLDRIAGLADRGEPPVLVPGGGPFADQVRRAQAHWAFDDHSAHRMALLAMEQTAVMLCALQPRLLEVDSVESLGRAVDRNRVPVWRPSRMVLADPDVPPSWDVSSDTLALWLARRLEASGVLLVKSAELPIADVAVASLQRRGLLDAAFQRYLDRLECPVWLVHKARSQSLSLLLGAASGVPNDEGIVRLQVPISDDGVGVPDPILASM